MDQDVCSNSPAHQTPLEKEAQRERDVSRLIELGAETRARAIELLERYGSLQAAANALCAAVDASIPSEVRKWVEQLRSGGERQKEEAAGELWSLACIIDNQVAIAKAGGIAPLVALARDGSDGQKEWAARALRNLAHNADNKVAIANAGWR